jgi:hypothetical protein
VSEHLHRSWGGPLVRGRRPRRLLRALQDAEAVVPDAGRGRPGPRLPRPGGPPEALSSIRTDSIKENDGSRELNDSLSLDANRSTIERGKTAITSAVDSADVDC